MTMENLEGQRRTSDMNNITMIPGKIEEEPDVARVQALAYIDRYGNFLSDGKVELSVLCDGCYAYLMNLYEILMSAGYTVVDYRAEDVESPDSHKPWMTTRFVAIGKLVQTNG